MRKMPWLTALAAAFASAACSGKDSFDIKVYPCPRSSARIVVDGTLDEAGWRDAPLVGAFLAYGTADLANPQTFFRALATDTHLYLGIRCDEPKMQRLVASPAARDSGGIFGAESIELFIDPPHDHQEYVQIAISAAGSIFDSRNRNTYWNANAVAATGRGEDHWTVEFALPWADLGVVPNSGTVLGLNVCRNRHLGGGRQWSYWSRTLKGGYHDPARFGHLLISPTAQQLVDAGQECRKGDRRGALHVYTAMGFSQTTYRSLAWSSVARLRDRLAGLEATRQAERDPAARAALDGVLARYRGRCAELNEAAETDAGADAATWTQIDLQVERMLPEIDGAIWEARLQALLARL